MSNILLRYGISRNKSLALPLHEDLGPGFHVHNLFNRNMVFNYNPSGPKFELLINHARYNRREMEEVVPNAVYLASLRDPVTQFESAFGYYEVSQRVLHQKNPTEEALQLFLSDAKRYLNSTKYGDYALWNGQLSDLGVQRSLFENPAMIKKKIKKLDKEFNLVLISEYIDESLILMKNLLCLDFTDILYLPVNVRSNSHKINITKMEIATQIRTWNSGDVMLYEHFNRTLWQKIRKEGTKFYQDLNTFRKLKQEVTDDCVMSRDADADQRLWKQTINGSNPLCKHLTRGTNSYLMNLRDSIKEQEELKNKTTSTETTRLTRTTRHTVRTAHVPCRPPFSCKHVWDFIQLL